MWRCRDVGSHEPVPTIVEKSAVTRHAVDNRGQSAVAGGFALAWQLVSVAKMFITVQYRVSWVVLCIYMLLTKNAYDDSLHVKHGFHTLAMHELHFAV